MGLFDDVLGYNESLIKNENALDFDFIPKIIPHREQEQRIIAAVINPLFSNRNGRNVFVFGKPGVGKTLAAKHVLRELEEKTDDIKQVYVNCWQQNTTYKVAVAICEEIGFRFVQNKNTTELFKVISRIVNDNSAVFIFDEVDKVEDTDFLYHLLEEIYRKSIILITNHKEWLIGLDERVKSRLTPEQLEFRPYTSEETKSIIKHRLGDAFPEGVWDEVALNKILEKIGEMKDIRSGLFLLRECALNAESKAKRKIEIEDVEKAITKMADSGFTIKNSDDLEEETKFIFDLVKKNSGKKIGEMYELYQAEGGTSSYKTFQRKIDKLSENKFIQTTKSTGKGGNTTIVEKKLTEF